MHNIKSKINRYPSEVEVEVLELEKDEPDTFDDDDYQILDWLVNLEVDLWKEEKNHNPTKISPSTNMLV